MKAKHVIFGFAMLVLMTLTFLSCNKESTSSGSGLNLKMVGVNPQYNLPVQNGGSGSINSSNPSVRWDTAIMVVSKVVAEAEKLASIQNGDSNKPQYLWYGPKIINLFDQNATIGIIPVPPGYYNEVEIWLYGNKIDAGKNPVLYLSGIYTNSGGMKFSMIIDITNDVILKVEKQNVNLNVSTVRQQSGMIQLALDKLFSNILPLTLDHIGTTTGKIIISETSNTDLYNQILKQLALIASIDFDH